MTTIQSTVPMYNDSGGHSQPMQPVEVRVNQGITCSLGPPPSETNTQPDVYIERKPSAWQINVSPSGTDIEVVVTINDDGSFTVDAPSESLHRTA